MLKWSNDVVDFLYFLWPWKAYAITLYIVRYSGVSCPISAGQVVGGFKVRVRPAYPVFYTAVIVNSPELHLEALYSGTTIFE
jgi:hypothetical protein